MRRRGARRPELGEAESRFLRWRTVSLTTRRRYEIGISTYFRFAAIIGTPILMPSDMAPLDDDQLRRHDALLDKSIHRLFFDGASLQQAREHLYGVAWGLLSRRSRWLGRPSGASPGCVPLCQGTP